MTATAEAKTADLQTEALVEKLFPIILEDAKSYLISQGVPADNKPLDTQTALDAYAKLVGHAEKYRTWAREWREEKTQTEERVKRQLIGNGFNQGPVNNLTESLRPAFQRAKNRHNTQIVWVDSA